MDTLTPGSLLVAGIYYVMAGILTFFSFFGVYVLIRYGKSKSLSLTVAAVFSLFYLKILSDSHQTLIGIL